MRHLYQRHFRDIENYCIYRCNRIINEYTLEHKWSYKGQYKGYLYAIKLMRFNRLRGYYTTPYFEIYNNLKDARKFVQKRYHPKPEYIRGISHSIYDVINYIQELP